MPPRISRKILIQSLQKHVEVDEPELEAVPALSSAPQDSRPESAGDIQFDRMTEEDLLRGLEGLVPPAETEDDGD